MTARHRGGPWVAAWVAFWANYFHPTLTLSTPLDNVLAFGIATLFPLVLLRYVESWPGLWLRGLALMLLLPAAVVSLLLAPIAAIEAYTVINDGDEGTFTRIASAPARWGEVRVYRVACNLGCGTRLVVRHETPLVPGLGVSVVRELHRQQQADGVRLERIGTTDDYRVTVSADRGERSGIVITVARPCSGPVRPLSCLWGARP